MNMQEIIANTGRMPRSAQILASFLKQTDDVRASLARSIILNPSLKFTFTTTQGIGGQNSFPTTLRSLFGEDNFKIMVELLDPKDKVRKDNTLITDGMFLTCLLIVNVDQIPPELDADQTKLLLECQEIRRLYWEQENSDALNFAATF